MIVPAAAGIDTSSFIESTRRHSRAALVLA
jgi:hypothetical protein